MHSRTPCDSSTAQMAFYVSKVKRLHAYFFARLIKAVLYHFLYLWRGCIRFLVHPSAQLSAVCLIMAYRAQARQKRDIKKYPLSITNLNYWAYIVFVL